jgi:hypothetical protein
MRRFPPFVFASFLIACGSTAGTDDAASAKQEFWADYHAGNIDQIPTAREHLLAAFANHPDDDELPRLVGMSYPLATLEGTGATNNPQTQMQTAKQEADYLDQARNVATLPYSKALDDTLYSGYPFLQGLQTNNTDLIQQALDLQSPVEAQYPVLGYFSSATILMRAAATSTYFTHGVENYFRFLELCVGAPIDRTSPDVSGMLHATSTDPLCHATANVPHLVEGGLFLFADVLVKNNQIEAAKAVYAVVKQSDGFATWRYRDLVDQRLGADLSALAATFRAGAPVSLGASPCLACHQGSTT